MPSLFDTRNDLGADERMYIQALRQIINPKFPTPGSVAPSFIPEKNVKGQMPFGGYESERGLHELLRMIKNPHVFKAIQRQMSQYNLRNMQNPGNTFPKPRYFKEFNALNHYLGVTGDLNEKMLGLMNDWR